MALLFNVVAMYLLYRKDLDFYILKEYNIHLWAFRGDPYFAGPYGRASRAYA